MKDKKSVARPLILEAVVIVGSILLAFGIDAQWNLVRERAEAEALLRGLQEDFAATVVEARRVRDNHAGGAAATEQLILLAEQGTLDPSHVGVVDSLLSIVAVSGASFDPPQGAISVLLRARAFGSLNAPDLVAQLTAWPADVADLKGQEAQLGLNLGGLFGALSDHGVRTDHLIATDHPGADFGDLPWEPAPTRAWAALNTTEGRNALASTFLSLRFTTLAAEQRLRSSSQILAMLSKMEE